MKTQTNSLNTRRIVALLRVKGEEMETKDLRLALALAVNDLARQTILGKTIRESDAENLHNPKNQMPVLHEFLEMLAKEGVVQVTHRPSGEWVCLGPDAKDVRELPKAEQRRVEQAVAAMAKILESVKKVA